MFHTSHICSERAAAPSRPAQEAGVRGEGGGAQEKPPACMSVDVGVSPGSVRERAKGESSGSASL